GTCWLGLFRNAVVADGFPIMRRLHSGRGLDISLEVMARLAKTSYLVDFRERTFLKGFSTMLAVTEVVGTTVFWHLFYNQDGGYISYEETRVPRIQDEDSAPTIDADALLNSRHIPGRCEKVSCLAG
ncbi:hypothetical protein QBC35DRAFT_346162, partial [Podospora australis]